VEYVQYTDENAMQRAFLRHHDDTADETCADGDGQGNYSIQENQRGEWACYVSTSGAGVVIWTDWQYPVLGIMSNSTMTPGRSTTRS
jgi:hypothetical protein